jgi:hypothetical protein
MAGNFRADRDRRRKMNGTLKKRIAELLEQKKISLTQLVGGANNKVFRVNAGGKKYLLKLYFSHPEDKRNRLDSEFSFCEFAWDNGIRSLPRPFVFDRKGNFAIYEFIDGRLLAHKEISEKYIAQALEFYKKLNLKKHTDTAGSLPLASEACFTLKSHLDRVGDRVNALKDIDIRTPVDREAAGFVKKDLVKAWEDLKASVLAKAKGLGLSLDEKLGEKDRCISPSDFGFHNALLTPSGELRFIDFEYAGWDDPAKMACDFFCQPKLTVPAKYFEGFVKKVISGSSGPQYHARRIRLLLPVYRIKWCCIMLNHFLKAGSLRRRFASDADDYEGQKAIQLKKARAALKAVKT